MPNPKPILISGGGLSSLLLGQSLLRSKIPFQILERDASFVFRAQGYRLRLSAEGLDAVESVLAPEHWDLFWSKSGKTGGSGFAILDAITGEPIDETLTVGSGLSSRGGKVVGMARGDMRQIFAKGLESHIQWNKKVAGYELTDGGVHAVFHDGSRSDEGSMLIAGDGIYSKIAQQVSGGKLKTYDTGARGIHGQAPTTAFKGLGEGVFALRGPDGVSIITNVRSGEMDDAGVEFGWTMTGRPGTIQAPNDDYSIVGAVAAAIAKDLTRQWHPRFRALVDEMRADEAAFWKITCSTPSGVPEWPNVPRVTVIGDAAHSMTPAGGLGANTALRDSALLGRLLREAGGFREGLTAAYEKEMRVYGSEAVGQSYGLASKQFGVHIEEGKTKLAWE
ncbi:FAD-binding domain protein [Cordyceps militaris CM01]|uniref:FAD-binding domain protein n=2 Tax=Cordyceps militaris TaxID=73501 RepID=G3J800_CORMM|nr:FAD-binding domain protein [Cordyceps militaris CM01]ATY66757.1 FAD-binding domain [Cordyceps militaris]EGX97211.1 FAD-binding domain protein [Cordyceps militaris CM01]